MRFLLIIGLCLLSYACHNGTVTHHRTYVISKSQEAEIMEPQSD